MRHLVIVGLGNHANAEKIHGRPLIGTKHNAGYEMVNLWRERLGLPWIQERACLATEAVTIAGRFVQFAAPNLTDLNHSGNDLVRDFWEDGYRPIAVIDDMDLPVGTWRYRKDGGDGGHRGLLSLQTTYGPTPRIRLGIGRPPEGVSVLEHVMSPLDPEWIKWAKDNAADFYDNTLHSIIANLKEYA